MARSLHLPSEPGHLIRRAQQAHNAIWAAEVGTEVTSVQFAVLNSLVANPGIDQRSLGELVGADRSTVADVAERLGGRGLLRQERDPNDGRRRLLSLTLMGMRLHQELLPSVDRVRQRLTGTLTDAERETLLALLQQVVVGAGPAEPDDDPTGEIELDATVTPA